MEHNITARLVPLPLYQLTYSPHHKPSGVPFNAYASRAVLAERRTHEIEAANADQATAMFERDKGCMVTDCMRLQSDAPTYWREAGQVNTALLNTIAGVLLVGLALSYMGPHLGQDVPYDSYPPAPDAQLQSEGARLDAEARHKCRTIGGDNTGYIPVDGGGIICTDKRGRKLRGTALAAAGGAL